MSNGRDFTKIIEAARIHYENLKTDISNASNRVEHIRLTALAQEAHNLLTDLRIFEVGLVYSHTASAANMQLQQESDPGSELLTETPLDLPEFRSPFDPRHNIV